MNQDTRQAGMISGEFGRIMKDLNVAVAVVGVDGTLHEWNPVATQFTGYSKKEVIGKNIGEVMIVTDDYLPGAIALIEQGLRGIETSGFECEVIRRDEKTIFILLSSTVMRDDQDKVTGIVLVSQDISESKRQEQQLLQYRDLITDSSDLVFRLDQNGIFTFLSPSVEQITGFTPEDAVGKSIFDFFTSESLDFLMGILPLDKNTPDDITHELIHIRKDGSQFLAEVHATIVYGDDGEMIGIQGISRDITERKKMESLLEDSIHAKFSAVAQSEAFSQQSAEMAHLGYAIWDDDLDRDITISDELARIHGLTVDEYLATVSSMEAYLKFVAPDDRAKYIDYEKKITSDSEYHAAGVEYRIVLPDGEIRHLNQRSQYISNHPEQPTQSIVVIQDVTEQKRVDDALKKSLVALEESEAMLTQSVAMANLGHAVWDYDNGKYLHVSTEWAGICGFTKEEFIKKFSSLEANINLVHPDDVERYIAYYENKDSDHIEFRILTGNNDIRHIVQSYILLSSGSGDPGRMLVTIQDISDRIERENELEKTKNEAELASLAKSSFLALVSHEIRTPLNAVLGALGLIGSEDLDPSLRKFLDVGRKGAESLLLIINDILDFSKMEAGKLQLEPTLFNVQKTIADVLQVLEPRALEKNISITGDRGLDASELLIGDAGRIRQVLLNLCSNAVRFTTEGGVHISTSKQSLPDEIVHVRFQIEDTGCGVPLKNQEHLFEEFWGTGATTLDTTSSTGLGLTISKQLVEMMGGSIGFESEPGRGSVFWFELPLKTSDNEAVQLESNRPKTFEQVAPYADLPLLQGRVLLAEDNTANQLIEQTVLERMGLQVDVVANGHEVIAAVRSMPYDLILMDINMPEMDGIEATAAIRKMPGALSSIPIIAMTALAMPGDREKFLSQGMDGYVSKPIIREELHACLSSILAGLELVSVASNGSSDVKLTDTDTSIIDAKILNALIVDVGTELLPEIIDTYLSEVPIRVDAITAAAACGNCELVAKEAHPLKSSSTYLGAMGLAELASELERAGREHNLEKIRLEVLHLPRLSRQTREELLRGY